MFSSHLVSSQLQVDSEPQLGGSGDGGSGSINRFSAVEGGSEVGSGRRAEVVVHALLLVLGGSAHASNAVDGGVCSCDGPARVGGRGGCGDGGLLAMLDAQGQRLGGWAREEARGLESCRGAKGRRGGGAMHR